VRARHLLAVVGAVALGAGCRTPETKVAIGFTDAPPTPLLSLLRAVIDSTHRAGWPAIELTIPRTAYTYSGSPYPIQAMRNALALSERPEVIGAVGPLGSQGAILLGPVYRDAGIAFVLPTANPPVLAALGPPAFILAPSVDEEARVMADFVLGQGRARTATVFYDPGSWGLALEAAVTAELWFRGVRVLGRFPIPIGGPCTTAANTPIHVVTSALRAGRPDVVVLAAHNQASVCVTRAVAAAGIRSATFIAGDGTVITPELVAGLGAARDRFHAVTFWDPASTTDESRAFLRAFEHAVGRRPSYDEAMIFDATMILVAAIRHGGPDRASVHRYLASLGRDLPAYRGATGSLEFRGTWSGRAFIQAAADVSPLGAGTVEGGGQ